MGKDKGCKGETLNCGGNPLYGIGLIGALVYYLQQADGFWPVIVALFKAMIWPAFLVYDLLKFLS